VAVISLSINLLHEAAKAVATAMIADMSLGGLLSRLSAEHLPNHDRGQSALNQHLLLHHHMISDMSVTPAAVGMRTGDVLTLLSQPAGERTPSLYFNVFRESGDSLEIADDLPLGMALPYIRAAIDPERSSAHEVTNPFALYWGRLIMPGDLERPLDALGIRDHDLLSLVQVRRQSSQVALMLASPRGLHAPFRLDYSPAVLGRFERGQADQPPDIDLSPALGRGKEHIVAQRQAEFIEDDGAWGVALHRDAAVPMFVDNMRASATQLIMLAEGNVISFGGSPNQPHFQLVVRFEAD
jgi:hypothetical protein